MINWASRPGQALAILLIACGLSVIWLVTNLQFSSGVVRWIVLGVIAIPVYLLLEGLAGQIFSQESGEGLSRKNFSWKRVWYALFVILLVIGLTVGFRQVFRTALTTLSVDS
ncbi:hypothetical protein MYX04_11800 [Nitrospiraceae bacterium AH_259_D15_M11_P09]|nr:hypothetical protein [Nitrospiraceae bacterium AH_259_D15_M11_P09]